MFNFGQSFGAIKGICAALGLPIFFVRPSKWKKHFNQLIHQKTQVEPKLSRCTLCYLAVCQKKDVNKADAILIARYFSETRLGLH